jgi:hypothetical protein
MSAEEMRRRTVGRLEAMKDSEFGKLRRLRHGPGQVVQGEKGMTAVPPVTIEYIGVTHCEIVASVEAIERAIEIINDTYRVLTSPASLPEEEQEPQQQERIY